MSKRTGEIYNVQVAVYAWMAVEAGSPQEAMEIAKKWKDEYITERDFEDSDIEVDSCETYPSDIDDYDCDTNIFCEDKVISVDEYYEEMDEKDE